MRRLTAQRLQASVDLRCRCYYRSPLPFYFAAARSSYFVERFHATCKLTMLQKVCALRAVGFHRCLQHLTRPLKISQTSYSSLCSMLFARHGNDAFVRCAASTILHCCMSEMKCSASVYHGSPSKQVQQFGQGLRSVAAAAAAAAAAADAHPDATRALYEFCGATKDAPMLILVTCASSGRKFIFGSPVLSTQ
jgi:hypothetical protein